MLPIFTYNQIKHATASKPIWPLSQCSHSIGLSGILFIRELNGLLHSWKENINIKQWSINTAKIRRYWWHDVKALPLIILGECFQYPQILNYLTAILKSKLYKHDCVVVKFVLLQHHRRRLSISTDTLTYLIEILLCSGEVYTSAIYGFKSWPMAFMLCFLEKLFIILVWHHKPYY